MSRWEYDNRYFGDGWRYIWEHLLDGLDNPGRRVCVCRENRGPRVKAILLHGSRIVEVVYGQSVWWDAATHELRVEHCMKFAKRAEVVAGNKAIAVTADMQAWVQSHQALWEYLTAATWEDGSTRETSMVMIFAEDGFMKACLQDRANQRSLWVTGGSIDGLLATLESKLQNCDDSDWRASRGYQKANKPSRR